MGDSLAKSPDATPEGRELNNRVEIVVHPDDVKVVNSQKLPALSDRRQVLMNLQYAQGPAVTKLEITERREGPSVCDRQQLLPRKAGAGGQGRRGEVGTGVMEANV
jgi:hypothetical protein